MGQARMGELKRARKRRRRERQSTAARLGVQARAVRDRGIKPGEVGDLLAARPGWPIAEQERRWAPEVGRARRETGQLVGQLLRRALGDDGGQVRDP
jgi:hypothetical protein